MAIDPVCKMKVDEGKAGYVSSYQGKNYYFCCEGCKTKFDRSPQKFV